MAKQPDLKAHPAADVFPMMSGPELMTLGADIARNGQQHSIKLWNGLIVDGRNRYEACRAAGVPPAVEDIDFKSEGECIRYIMSENIHRRHLTDEQRDLIGARLVTMQANGDRGDPQNAGRVGVAAAAAMVHSTPARIERARTIERADPKLADKVIRGEMSKGKAMKEIKERSRPTQPATDPDRADDAVVDAKIERASNGYTPKMEKVWASYSALDAVEQTAFRERMNA
jgi:ParB-like chromosome segregation protein Spo0J